MATNCTGDDGELGVSKWLSNSKLNKGHVQDDFDAAIGSNDNGWDDGGLGEEIVEIF